MGFRIEHPKVKFNFICVQLYVAVKFILPVTIIQYSITKMKNKETWLVTSADKIDI